MTVDWPEPRSPWPILLLLGTLLALVFLAELTIGVVWIPPDQVFTVLSGGDPARASWVRIVLDFRLPRALAAMAGGAALGVAGLLLQTVLRNPLADPWILGVVHGARLGVAVLVVAIGAAGEEALSALGVLGEASFALAAGTGAALLIVCLSLVAPRVSSVTLLIVGLMLGFACQGLISIVLHLTDEGHALVFQEWDDGSFAGVSRSRIMTLAGAVGIGLIGAAVLVKPLDALLLGERYARSVGLAVAPVRFAVLAITALLAGAVTAFCGPIAFLGILVPHACRVVARTSEHQVLLPSCILAGATLAMTADLITHLPWSTHLLHLNAVNGLVGAPLIVWMVMRGRRLKLPD
jgi:iron complex transport system permease protein